MFLSYQNGIEHETGGREQLPEGASRGLGIQVWLALEHLPYCDSESVSISFGAALIPNRNKGAASNSGSKPLEETDTDPESQ